MSFASLGLRAELLRALSDAGYTTPTPVQAQAIPEILQSRDILAGAQTGTGKTAGFTLPMLQRLHAGSANATASSRPGYSRKHVRALILTPTRELAAQVEESVQTYGKYLPLTSTTMFGGVPINPQIHALRRGVDILVATPGRLLDHVNQRTVDLSHVEILVLDEADRMLSMGFIKDIRKILGLLPTKRQNLLFSATFSNEIKALADSLLNSPVRVEVARQNEESDLVTQSVYLATRDNKRELLVHLLTEEKIWQALVFTRTKHGADRLAQQLQRAGISAAPIHGNRSQPQRMRALADFKRGAARILVATDIAARGLDIDQLPHVINFELPNVPEDYVHRIGRTGRAGSQGEAISLVSSDEQAYLVAIEKLIKKRIARREAAGFEVPAFPVSAPVNSGPRPVNARSNNYARTKSQARWGNNTSRSTN
jgi:ATP-dependent RNA helicase RhlE